MIVETISNKIIDLTDIKAGDITLEDVVGGLANINRFNGRHNAYSKPVTVLQHSYAMYLYVKQTQPDNQNLAITCLIHDAPEAYTGDIIAPIKKYLPQIAEVERKIFDVLAMVYKLPTTMSEGVKNVDNLACQTEWAEVVAPNADVCAHNLKYYGGTDKLPTEYEHMGEALDKALALSTTELIKTVLDILDVYYNDGGFVEVVVTSKHGYREVFNYNQTEDICATVHNIYTTKPIKDGDIYITSSQKDTLQAVIDILSSGDTYVGELVNDTIVRISHRVGGTLLKVIDYESYTTAEPISPSLVSTLAGLDKGGYAQMHMDCETVVETENYVINVLAQMHQHVRQGDIVARVQQLKGKILTIFFVLDYSVPTYVYNLNSSELPLLHIGNSIRVRLDDFYNSDGYIEHIAPGVETPDNFRVYIEYSHRSFTRHAVITRVK